MSKEQQRQINVIVKGAREAGFFDEAKGLNYQKLRKASKIAVSLLYKYTESDPKKWVRVGLKNIPRLAKALGIDPSEFV